MPAGTAGDWIAYGYSGWSRTVFNNEWCGYVSSAVHEIGHNLGLSHSAKGNVEYGDKQGMMGFSYRRINAPAMYVALQEKKEMIENKRISLLIFPTTPSGASMLTSIGFSVGTKVGLSQ